MDNTCAAVNDSLGADEVGQSGGQTGDGQEVAEHVGADQNQEHHAGGLDGLNQRGLEHLPVEGLLIQHVQEGAENTHSGGLTDLKGIHLNAIDLCFVGKDQQIVLVFG